MFPDPARCGGWRSTRNPSPRGRLRQRREMSHDGTGFPAEPGTIILRSCAGGEPPLRSFLLIQHAEVHGRLAQHAGVQGALQGGAHGFFGGLMGHEDQRHALAFVGTLDDLGHAHALVGHAAGQIAQHAGLVSTMTRT